MTGVSERVAYRLAFEEGLRKQAELITMLEQYRARATQFLAAAVIAAGVGLSGVDWAKEPPSGGWLLLMLVGLMATLAAAMVLVSGVRANFRLDPRIIVAYGDDRDRLPTDDDIYEELALWLAQLTRILYERVDRRRKWLYVSMLGATMMLVGIVMLRVGTIY